MGKDKLKEFEEFYAQFVTRNYKKGEMLIRADDDPQGIFCLTRDILDNIPSPKWARN